MVITIIVLLILAGVSLRLVAGNEGILGRAESSVEKYNKATQKEDEDLKSMEDVIAKYDGTSTNPPAEEKRITAADIARSSDKSEYYGATVTGYACENSAGVNAWKILYADESNIYLITDDYIHYDYVPQSATQTIHKTSDYEFYMSDEIENYNGSSDIKESRIQALNSNYFRYLTENNITSTNLNMKKVASLLDTDVWTPFAGNKAEYAVGAPSIELLFKSYNEKYGTNYQTRVNSITGYEISADGGSTWSTIYSNMFNKSDSLYVVEKNETSESMFIASPSGNYDGDVMCYYSGIYYASGANPGIRPMVCLSSDVQLEKISDGTYAIK